MRRIAMACLVLAATGCEIPPEAADQATCATICACFESLPAKRDQCELQCMQQLAPVSEACEVCVADHADRCETLVSDCNACGGGTP